MESGFQPLALSGLRESARTESAPTLIFSAESAATGSYRKKLRPIDQNTVLPSGAHPMKSPPMRVSRFTGNAAAEGSETLMLGVSPPISGNVTR